jgi:hypothetical protein
MVKKAGRRDGSKPLGRVVGKPDKSPASFPAEFHLGD